jgi:hypothetical protein
MVSLSLALFYHDDLALRGVFLLASIALSTWNSRILQAWSRQRADRRAQVRERWARKRRDRHLRAG